MIFGSLRRFRSMGAGISADAAALQEIHMPGYHRQYRIVRAACGVFLFLFGASHLFKTVSGGEADP